MRRAEGETRPGSGVRKSGNGIDEPARARDAGYRILAYRPRSRAELEAKLLGKGFAADVVRTVLSDFTRLGFVNDRQFARQWADGRVRLRGFGRRRIERELKEKGVEEDIVAEALDDVFAGEDELAIARRAARKRLNLLKSVDPEARRRRIAGFLERRGFPYAVIHTVLKESDEEYIE